MIKEILKLIKRINRKVGDKEYYKYELIVSPDIIKTLGWDEKHELRAKARNGKLVIEKA